MPINRIAFGFLVLTCVVAAGGGAYLATRANDPAAPAEVRSSAAVPAVTETEALVDEVPTVEAPRVEEVAAPVAAPAAAPTARRDTSSATAASRTAPRPASTSSERASRAPATPARARTDSRPSAAPDAASAASRNPVQSESTSQVAVMQSQPALGPVAIESRPPAPMFEELTIAADSVLGLQVEKAVTTENAKVEDKVEARVTRDVKVGGEIAVPAGSRVEGSVTLVEQGGKVKEQARLGVRFHTLVLADGTRVPLSTDALYREGASPAGASTAKIGGAAVGGAILGAILGGGKGATIGGAVGAAGGTAAVMASDRKAATLPAGSTVTVRILAPVTVTIEK
jgi:hypothetical protein